MKLPEPHSLNDGAELGAAAASLRGGIFHPKEQAHTNALTRCEGNSPCDSKCMFWSFFGLYHECTVWRELKLFTGGIIVKDCCWVGSAHDATLTRIKGAVHHGAASCDATASNDLALRV